MAVNAGSGSSAGKPWSLVTVGPPGLSFGQRCRVSPNHGGDMVRRHHPLHQGCSLGRIRAVVIEDFLDRQLLAFFLYENASLIVELLDGQLNALFLILAGLSLAAGGGHDDADGDGVIRSRCRFGTAKKRQDSDEKQSPRN